MKLITVCSDLDHVNNLYVTAVKNGWQDLVLLETEWKGFGTKLIETYNYLIDHPDTTEFIFCDAYDVMVLGTPEEFFEKKQLHFPYAHIIFSAEKGLWPPVAEKYRNNYPQTGGFDFLNSGLYYSTAKVFINNMNTFPPSYHSDDQFWMHEIYDKSLNGEMAIDTQQILFNSHSFIAEGEYTYDNNRVQIMGNQPCFIHSNGKTVDKNLEAFL